MGEDRIPGMMSWVDMMALGHLISDDELRRVQREQQFDEPITFSTRVPRPASPRGRH